MQTALIIDDMEKARTLLKKDVENYCPEIKVIGEADGVVSGTKAIRSHNPDIIFLDINMNDGSGFDILEMLGDHPMKVIFTTASDEHAIKAFKFAAVDYLLKPIDIEELQKAVKKAIKTNLKSNEHIGLLLENMNEDSDAPAEESHEDPKKAVKKIALHTMDKIHICNVPDIIRCESSVNYTTFFFADGEQILVTKTLKHYDELLTDSGFYRVHQSHLINLSQVREYVKIDGGYIVMNDGSNVPISSRKKAEVINLITNY